MVTPLTLSAQDVLAIGVAIYDYTRERTVAHVCALLGRGGAVVLARYIGGAPNLRQLTIAGRGFGPINVWPLRCAVRARGGASRFVWRGSVADVVERADEDAEPSERDLCVTLE